MRRSKAIVAALLIVVLMAGCVQEESKPEEKPKAVTTPTTYSLTTAGGTPGGVGFAIMTATMAVASKYYPEITYSVVPGGWVGNVIRVNTHELDLAHTTVASASLSKKQMGPFEGNPVPENVRGVFVDQVDNYYYIVARADFPYDTVDEIAAAKYPLRVTNQPKGTFAGWLWDEILNMTGMNESTIRALGGSYTRVSWSDAVALLRDGHVDAILAVSGKKVGWLEELTALRDVKYVSVSEELANKIMEKYGLQKVVIPAGTLPKQKNDIMGFSDTGYIIANKNVPDEVVYKIVKAIIEHPNEFRESHAMLETFQLGSRMFETSPFPLHPGAVKAYKEFGYMS
uniref:TAXI family TRAP transporter solute-binding subunit n=1 Tax=Geoglobus ahangari TaxID=113653 RepID=A0A7C4S668_9EURY